MITQIIKFTVKDKYQADFHQALLENKAGTALEANNMSMALFVDKKDPTIFFAHECWADQAAIDHHIMQPYTQKVLTLCQKALAEAPQVLNLNEAKPKALTPKLPSPNNVDERCIVFFIFNIDSQYHQPLLNQFEKHITHTRKEEGNLLFNLYTVEGDNTTLAVYEHWKNEAVLWDFHFQQSYAQETGALMEKAVIGDIPQYMHFVRELN